MKALFGLVPVRSGRCRSHGDDITALPAHELVARGVGYVPQTDNVFSALTVEDNLRMGMFLRPQAAETSGSSTIGELFPLLAERVPSGPARSRAVSARWSRWPGADDGAPVLLLDEPSAGLSPMIQDEVFNRVPSIHETGVAIVIVEQNARRCLADLRPRLRARSGQERATPAPAGICSTIPRWCSSIWGRWGRRARPSRTAGGIPDAIVWGVGDGGVMNTSHISAELDRLQREINNLRAEVRAGSKTAPAVAPRPSPRTEITARPQAPAAASPVLLQQLKSNARDPWRPAIPEMSTTKVLAWAGGGITVLGLVFLFALAASRGWITPTMRLVAGTLVSTGLVGASLWLHRRHGKLEAVMAAGAAGIAGLYATLAAATIVYHDLSQPQALAGAAGIALLAIAVALVIDGEELAAFGVSAAMLAPLLVAGKVTPAGVMFAAIMAATAPVLMARCGWRRMPVATWIVAAPLAYVMLGQAPPRAGLWTVAAVSLAVVWAVEMYQFGLAGKAPRSLDLVTGGFASLRRRRAWRRRLSGWPGHQLLGGDEAGWLLLAVAAVLGAGACGPWLLSRIIPISQISSVDTRWPPARQGVAC